MTYTVKCYFGDELDIIENVETLDEAIQIALLNMPYEQFELVWRFFPNNATCNTKTNNYDYVTIKKD